MNGLLVLDVETDTHNKGHPFDPRNICVSYATLDSLGNRVFKYYTDPDFIGFVREQLRNCEVLVGFNLKFDCHWLANLGVTIPDHVKIWDCQFAEFIYTGQSTPFPSLDGTLEAYSLPLKKKHVVHDLWEAGVQTRDIDRNILEDYNVGDIDVTLMLYHVQQNLLSEKQKALVYIEGEDMLSLMAAERAGIKFDVEGAKSCIAKNTADIYELEQQLNSKLPAGIPDGCWNWDSGDHLSVFLYGGTLEFRYVESKTTFKSGAKAGQEKNVWAKVTIDFPRMFRPLDDSELKKTAEKTDQEAPTRYYSTDQTILAQLNSNRKSKLQILAAIKQRSKLIKVSEMLESILDLFVEKHWENATIHPQYNQVVAVTGRLSSSQPNGQNTPVEVDKYLISRYAD